MWRWFPDFSYYRYSWIQHQLYCLQCYSRRDLWPWAGPRCQSLPTEFCLVLQRTVPTRHQRDRAWCEFHTHPNGDPAGLWYLHHPGFKHRWNGNDLIHVTSRRYIILYEINRLILYSNVSNVSISAWTPRIVRNCFRLLCISLAILKHTATYII